MSGRAIDVTVVVPMYNVERYLPDLFTCLAEQSYQGFRVIMVDDASTDNTYEVARYLAEPFGDRAIVLKNDTNLGLSGARNAGLDIACENPTEYISFLDSDDEFAPDYLDDLHAIAVKTKADLVIAGITRFEDDSGRVLCVEMTSFPSGKLFLSLERNELAFINPCSYAKLYRFAPIRDLRFRDIRRSEDTCYLFEAVSKLKTIAFTGNAYYRYRVRGNSLTTGIGIDKLESMHEVFPEVLGEFSDRTLSPLREMFESQVFIRSSIGGVMRLAFKDMKQIHALACNELTWLDANMPTWRTNKYLSFGKWRSETPKQLALKLSAAMYKAHIFPLFIYAYYFVSAVLKREVRA